MITATDRDVIMATDRDVIMATDRDVIMATDRDVITATGRKEILRRNGGEQNGSGLNQRIEIEIGMARSRAPILLSPPRPGL
ncbi:MAG: hypothetical protein R6V03_09930 [Kiritimatiellia bacterium]